MDHVREGFATLGVSEQVQRAALDNLNTWLGDPRTAAYVPLIHALIDAQDWNLLLDCFYQLIPFGTGGRRGPVGIGPNRINPFTLTSSIQGHCEYLRERYTTDDIAVVVAYDVRVYRDARGHYPYDVPNPLTGLTSRAFAELAAQVYAANGVRVHMLARGSDRFISTPELSFSIRQLGAQGGLNVSASHNPPDDNGAKVYDHLGGQTIPPHDEDLVNRVQSVTDVHTMDYQDAVDQGLIVALDMDLHNAYIQANVGLARTADQRSAHVVFTALHGTGDTTVVQVLRAAGFRCDLEPTQASHDGSFPNVPFGIPNPEVRQSMDRAVALATELGADLVMACDPDADRLGLVVRHGDGWRFLNGNEMGALVVKYALQQHPSKTPIVMKSLVTSSLVTRLAQAAGAQVAGDLLVGFKYVAEGLRSLEETGAYLNLKGSAADYAVGVEESHGVLVTPLIRDKDAAGAALLLAEAASTLKGQGKTLIDLLEQAWTEVGYVSNRLICTVMRGAAGQARIESIQQAFRDNPPTSIGGYPVRVFKDLADESGPMGPFVSNTDRAGRNVLIFELGGDTQVGRVVLRPSGTEPKNKIYAELFGQPGADLATEIPRVDAACRALAEDFALVMLGTCGLEVPRWALGVSDLVTVEHKQHFAHELVPSLLARAEAGMELHMWLDDALAPYGKDPRGLVAPAVVTLLQGKTDPVSLRVLSLFQS